jgi:hypothetical protein
MPKQHNALYGDDLHNPKGMTVDSHASSSKFVISASNMTITASGFTVKATAFQGDGSGLTGVPANDWDGSHTGDGTISGTLTAGQFVGGGAGITGVTAEWDGTHTGTATFTGNVTASGNISASSASTGSFGRVEATTFDGVDIATRDAILTSTTTTAGAALPKAGGAMTGAITTNSTFDGVDISARDGVLTYAAAQANDALPASGGTMTGGLTGTTATFTDAATFKNNVSISGSLSTLHTITFIGSQSLGANLPVVSGVDQTQNRPDGGILHFTDFSSSLQEDDLLIMVYASNEGNADTGSVNWPGWTTLNRSGGNFAKSTFSYKFMGATPDTYVSASTHATQGIAVVMAFRNVDTTTPMDVTPQFSEDYNVGNPNSPSITTATNGAAIISLWAGRSYVQAAGTTAPSGFTHIIETTGQYYNGGWVYDDRAQTATSWKLQTTAGAIDPGNWGYYHGSAEALTATVALRPSNTPQSGNLILYTGDISGSSISTGSFGRVEASGVVYADSFQSVTGGDSIDFADDLNVTGNVTASGHVSSSATSTGSFGNMEVVNNIDAAKISLSSVRSEFSYTSPKADSNITLVGSTITTTPMSGLQEDDFLIYMCTSEWSSTWPATTALDAYGFTHLEQTVISLTHLDTFYKKVTSTIDTVFPDVAGTYGSVLVQAFRGVDGTTPFDASTVETTHTQDNADPATITTVSANSVVLVVGGLQGNNFAFTAAPSGYGNLTLGDANNSYTRVGSAFKTLAVAAAENPQEFTNNSGPWAVQTIALRKDTATDETIDYSLGNLGQALSGGVSGSAASTGSFGRLEGDGSGITDITDTAALPKAGGTMTGALIGTSATFTGDITAKNYIVSSSVTYMTTSFSSGSTIFGDTADDTHKFIGSITASGVVSASGGFVGDGSNLTGVSSFAGSAGTETLFSGSAASTGSFGKLIFDGSALSASYSYISAANLITYVGSATSQGSAYASLPAGTSEGDVVLYVWYHGGTSYSAGQTTTQSEMLAGFSSGSYTLIATDNYSGDTYMNSNLWGKVMGATPDTVIPAAGVSTGNVAAHVFRGIDTSTYLDVTTTKTIWEHNTSPNPPDITTANDSSAIISLTSMVNAYPTSGPSGYSSFYRADPSAYTSDHGMSYLLNAGTAGAKTVPSWAATIPSGTMRNIMFTVALRRNAGGEIVKLFKLSDFLNADPGDNTLVSISGSSASTGSFGRVQATTFVGDGSSLTGLTTADGFDYTSGSSPVITTNPSSVGSTWINSTSGEIFVATDITSNENVWQGTAGNTVEPGPTFTGTRGVFGGGAGPSNVIDYITISTTGNATDFGDLSAGRYDLAACSNGSRGIFGGGYVSNGSNIIDYITISTTGNATDFGNLTVSRWGLAASSNELRGIFGGGESPSTDTIDYITIATTGNAIDFGNLTSARRYPAGCSNGVRGLFGGGNGSGGNVDTIDYVTISTTGNATDFGDLTSTVYNQGATSNDTRGLFAGGYTTATDNKIDYVTIATTGNAADFGDLTQARRYLGACSDGTKAVFGGGVSTTNIMDYVTIATLANAADFGDLTVARGQLAGCSGT